MRTLKDKKFGSTGTTLAQELKTNPFFRVLQENRKDDDKTIKTLLQEKDGSEIEAITALRAQKT